MVPPFGTYPAEASLAAIEGEDISELAGQNVELLRENMKLRAQLDSLSARNATSEASWSTPDDCTQSLASKPKREKSKGAMGSSVSTATTTSFTSEAMFASDADDTPKSRLSRSSRQSKSRKLEFNADGDDMSRTPSTDTSFAASHVPSERTVYSEGETPKCQAYKEAEAPNIRGLHSGLLAPPGVHSGLDSCLQAPPGLDSGFLAPPGLDSGFLAPRKLDLSLLAALGLDSSPLPSPGLDSLPLTPPGLDCGLLASRKVDFASEADGRHKDEKTSTDNAALLGEVMEEHVGDTFDSEEQSRTAMMMRNIPSEYTRAYLIELLDREGFNGLYRLVYMPINMDTEMNHGYAFVCFSTGENAEKFKEQ